MDGLKEMENSVATGMKTVSSAYVPSLQLTVGQPAPIAANGGLSYMSFDQDGDAGTAAAIEAALRQIREGEEQAVIDMIENAPPGPIETKWGLGFRSYEECLDYIRANNIEAPEGGVALPLPYTVLEQPSYSIVSSNALWRDPARADMAKMFRREGQNISRGCLYFPQILRDARRMEEYYPGLSPTSPECMDKLGVSLAHIESKCQNFYDAAEVERVFYPEIEKLLLDFFPGATDAFVYNHGLFDKDYKGPGQGRSGQQGPGGQYLLRRHRPQRPERQQWAGTLPRAAHQEPAQLWTPAALHGGRGGREDVAAVHVDQPGQADGDRGPVPLRAVRLAIVCRPAVYHQLPNL